MKSAIVIKKLLIGFIALWLMGFAVSKIAGFYISATTPAFLGQIEKKAMTSPAISAKIGKQVGFKSTYNENDLATDTVKFKVEIQGENSNLLLSGKAVKRGADWVLVKVDSTYQQN